jgi:hypothetical protein
MIEFEQNELDLIRRLSVPGGWDVIEAAPLKRKIKDYFLGQGNAPCCYCGLSMSPWHRITIDIEHVLPKGRFPEYTFEIKNLNISCKRCNMTIKGEKVSFYLGISGKDDPFKSELYTFLHPNFDDRRDHLRTVNFQVDEDLLIKYCVLAGSAKGEATYEFFRLSELEINTFDRAQGNTAEARLDDLPPEIAEAVRALLPESGEI